MTTTRGAGPYIGYWGGIGMKLRLFFAIAVALLALAVLGPAALAAQQTPLAYKAWTTTADFAAGSAGGVAKAAVGDGALKLVRGVGQGAWTSPVVSRPSAVSFLVASWNADTPSGTWVQTDVQLLVNGHWTKWFVLGQWTWDDQAFLRTSVGGQSDADGYVAVDTWVAKDKPATAWRLRATLHAAPNGASPVLRALGATASDPRNANPVIPSITTMTRAVELAVPQLSQEIHAGQYPQYDGGGEAWCSATTTAMLVQYWGRGPSAAELAWVDPSYADPQVDHAARYTYDYRYKGCGNWPFNAAYAAHYGLSASMRQLASLSDAEAWLKAGVPLGASIVANPNQLTGFPFKFGTAGHLVVIRGFTAAGDVIVNDPAAAADATVRVIYDRAEFETCWLRGSAGVVYAFTPEGWPAP